MHVPKKLSKTVCIVCACVRVFAAQSKNDDDGKYFHGNCSVPSYDNGVHIPSTEQWDNGKTYLTSFITLFY